MAEKTADSAHTKTGTLYGEEGISHYSKHKHGPDGAKFLDPYLIEEIQSLEDILLLDSGAGSIPWSIYAAQNGARVFALDIQDGLFWGAENDQKVRPPGTAVLARNVAELNGKISLMKADGAKTPVPDKTFHKALHINVGCNLPLALNQEAKENMGFLAHFKEISRVLKDGGRAVVSAPTSFGEVFTDGSRKKSEVLAAIETALKFVNDQPDNSDYLKTVFNEMLKDVYRATFAKRNGEWKLIIDESELNEGEAIFRKLPGLTVPNYYHAQEEYEKAFRLAGLPIVKRHVEYFSTDEERQNYNETASEGKKLGPEYVGKPPFVVWVVEKPDPYAFMKDVYGI